MQGDLGEHTSLLSVKQVATHEWALHTARFQQVTWHDPALSAAIMEGTAQSFWADFLAHPPIVFIACGL